jgi:hypothetical protein
VTRRIVIGVLAVLALGSPTGRVFAWIGPLDLVVPGLPSPTDVVKLIDTLTQKDSATTVQVKLGNTIGQGKLLVARTRVEVKMERTSRNWRGKVVVQMVVPSDVTYSVDLSEIRREHVRHDVAKRVLIVKMPMPIVEDVTPILTGVKADNTYKRARFKFYDKDTSRALQNTMLTEDYLARARKKSAEETSQIREQGRLALQAFLERLVQGSSPGVRVVVE